uniref:Uncharacterized protein n=1 Tax=Ditylenchus dipsaci TaxID=166011 RepID=A0A915EIS2_9BILA
MSHANNHQQGDQPPTPDRPYRLRGNPKLPTRYRDFLPEEQSFGVPGGEIPSRLPDNDQPAKPKHLCMAAAAKAPSNAAVNVNVPLDYPSDTEESHTQEHDFNYVSDAPEQHTQHTTPYRYAALMNATGPTPELSGRALISPMISKAIFEN